MSAHVTPVEEGAQSCPLVEEGATSCPLVEEGAQRPKLLCQAAGASAVLVVVASVFMAR